MNIKKRIIKVVASFVGIFAISFCFDAQVLAEENEPMAVYSNGDISMFKGEDGILKPEFSWYFFFTKNYEYSSSDNNVISIDDKGYMRAINTGEAKVEASIKGIGAKKTFNVIVKEITVVLDAGHGGKDGGTADLNKKTKEKDFNLDVANACKKELENYYGINVVMTRNKDTFVELEDRCVIAKKANADILVSLHHNAAKKHDKNGAEVYVTHSKYKKTYNEDSTKLGENVLNELSKLGYKNSGVRTRLAKTLRFSFEDDKADYYHVIRNSVEKGFPGIIIEHGYMDNAADYARMDTAKERQNMGVADATAIANFYGLKRR